jgi:hypothetical protein
MLVIPLTVRADKGYHTREFVAVLHEMAVTPHVTEHTTNRASAIDARTTRHRAYALSQRARMRIQEIFGWLKTVGLLRKTRHRGTARVGLDVRLHLGGLQPGPNAKSWSRPHERPPRASSAARTGRAESARADRSV